MIQVTKQGDTGPAVESLQRELRAYGFSPGRIDGRFGPATRAAVLAYQRSEGLLADGIVGPLTRSCLWFEKKSAYTFGTGAITVDRVAEIFPYTPIGSISRNLPHVVDALERYDMLEKPLVIIALATIRAETEPFEPIDELPSRFNTSPRGHLFDLYDYRRDLGNQGPPDGARFRGRGFVQLTGRANYRALGRFIGVGERLLRAPELANDPSIAATVLVAFLSMRRRRLKEALVERDWRRARRLVNGGSHGLERFVDAVRIADRIFDDPVWPAHRVEMPTNA